MKNWITKGLLGLTLAWGAHAMAVEEPKFEVLSQDGAFQVRRYPPMLVAQTVVVGDMDEASNKGFRLIADFIFGNNQAPGGASKIAMTAPVTVEASSQKIAMTAPVTVEPAVVKNAEMSTATSWRVQFVMPASYTMASIPKPNNNLVTLHETASKTVAVLSYSGFNTAAKVQAKTDELWAWLAAQKHQPMGPPQLSRYDPPWTLPPWRRNEIMVEIIPL